MAWYKNHLVQKLTHGSMEQNTELRSKPTYLAKSKGERERHTQPNTEFRRTARRDKKTFFNEQSLKIEPNSRRGKTRDLLRTIGNIKGTFRPQMGAIEDRNGRHLAEDIKKRDGKNTRKNCTKKILMNWITTMVWSVTRARHSEV